MKNGWIDHVMIVKQNNPGLQFKDVLKLASKSYNKQSGSGYGINKFQNPLKAWNMMFPMAKINK